MGSLFHRQSTPSTTQATTIQDVPPWAQPYSQEVMTRAGELSREPFTPYPGQRVTPMTPTQQSALDMTRQRALGGDPLLSGARETVGATVGGQYLDSNPYVDALIGKSQQEALDVYQKAIQPTLDARAVRARAMGSSGYGEASQDIQEGLLKTIGDIGTQTRAELYNSERARQMASIPFAQELSQAPFADAQRLLQTGEVERQFAQEQANVEYENWLAQQQYPYQMLDLLSGGIRGGLGGAGVTTQVYPDPYRSNPLLSAMGLGTAGYAAGSMLGGTNPGNMPWYGAGLGGLLGLMYS